MHEPEEAEEAIEPKERPRRVKIPRQPKTPSRSPTEGYFVRPVEGCANFYKIRGTLAFHIRNIHPGITIPWLIYTDYDSREFETERITGIRKGV